VTRTLSASWQAKREALPTFAMRPGICSGYEGNQHPDLAGGAPG
jgi:hypothetical protein